MDAPENAASPPPSSRYDACTPAQREAAIRSLSASLAAVHAELLEVIRAADEAADWRDDGATAMSPWLVASCGVGSATAREWVRVGHALAELPALGRAYAAGELSWDQVRPATRFATAPTDAGLANELPGYSARQIGILARQRRPVPPAEACGRAELGFRPDHRRHGWRLSGFLPADAGAAVRAALGRAADQLGPDAVSGTLAPLSERLATALCDLAGQALGADPDPDLACVVVHVDADAVDGRTDENGLLGDLAVGRDSVLRLLCDCRVEYAVDGEHGATVGIGRAGRTVPAWLRRRIVHRDRCCRFPGCDRAIRHVHHLEHWSAGGRTDADNLVGLCWTHHHLVHEGGWTTSGDPERGDLEFRHPRGRIVSSRPQPIGRAVLDHLEIITGLRFRRGTDPDDDPDEPDGRSVSR